MDYTSSSQGRIEFGWRGLCWQNGHRLALHDFPRYENIYTETSFPAEVVEIHQGEYGVVLDWRKGERDVSRYADEAVCTSSF